MRNSLRAWAVAAVAAAVGLSGCIQAEQASTLFPDGSGKVTLNVAFKKSMIKMLQEMAKQFGGEEGKVPDPFEEFSNPDKLQENAEGIVAWSTPQKKEDGDWVRLTVSAYFEDINKVKMYNTSQSPTGEPQKKVSFAAKYEKTAAGHVLLLTNEATDEFKKMTEGKAEGGEELGKAMIEMMKPMLEGLKITMSITVPGPIEETRGFMEKKDRTASIVIDDKLLLGAMKGPDSEEAKKLKPLSEAKEGKITWKENKVSDEDVAKFKKELADAKAQWAKTLEEHKKKKQ